MRTANSWCDVVHPSEALGGEGELERQIKRIQADAIIHAGKLIKLIGAVAKSDILQQLAKEAKELDPATPVTPSEWDKHVKQLINHGSGPWGIRRSGSGYAVAITRDGSDVLHLQEGTCRNEACIEAFVNMLNGNYVQERNR